MALTQDEIHQIKEALQPAFDRLEHKISERLEKKIDEVKNRLTDAIGSIPDIMHRDFPTRDEVTKGLDAFKETIAGGTSP
jgi:hypothetical protein